jgi:hypothetical protein
MKMINSLSEAKIYTKQSLRKGVKTRRWDLAYMPPPPPNTKKLLVATLFLPQTKLVAKICLNKAKIIALVPK